MNWYFTLSKGKQIAWAVIGAHVLLLFLLAGDHWVMRSTRKPKKIAVRTTVLHPVSIEKPPSEKKPSHQATPSPAKKTVPNKPAPQKKEKPSQMAAPKSSSPKKQEKIEILKELSQKLESIAKTEPMPEKKTELLIPTLNPVFEFSSDTPEEKLDSAERIATLLREELRLPEFGEVKVLLRISSLGKLESCEILQSKSAKNAEFLKKRLPELHYPCLNETASITIAFRNEE